MSYESQCIVERCYFISAMVRILRREVHFVKIHRVRVSEFLRANMVGSRFFCEILGAKVARPFNQNH